MDKKCTYVWNTYKWKNWTFCKHLYLLWCINFIKPITQNGRQHQHTRTCEKNNHVVCKFHYPLLLMCEIKILKPLQINGNSPFSQQYLHTQLNKIFQSFNFKKNDDISFFLNLKFVNLDESTYILSLKSKLIISTIL